MTPSVSIKIFWEYFNTIFELFCLFHILTKSLHEDLRSPFFIQHSHSTVLISSCIMGFFCRYLLNQIEFPFPGLIGFYILLGLLFSIIVFRRNFFNYSLLIVIYSTLVMLLRHIVCIIFGLYIQPFQENSSDLLLQSSTLLCILVMSQVLILVYKNIPNALTFSNWFFFVLLFICVYYAFNQIESQLSQESSMLIIFIIITILVYDIFFQMLHIAANYEKRMKDQMLIKELTMNRAHIKEIDHLYENLRLLRHELKNNVFYMQSLLEDHEYEKLDQYFCEFSQKFEHSESFFDTGNKDLNSILNSKLSESVRQKIPIDVHAAAPEELPVKPDELFSLVSNMLDNALEGMSQKEPGLSIIIQPQKGYLSIEVKNRIDHDILKENPTLSTTKPDAAFHGYGIKIMKEIVSRHEGWIDFSENDHYFSAHAYLLLSDL